MKFKLSLVVLLILSINLVKCDESDDEFDDGVTVEEEIVSINIATNNEEG